MGRRRHRRRGRQRGLPRGQQRGGGGCGAKVDDGSDGGGAFLPSPPLSQI